MPKKEDNSLHLLNKALRYPIEKLFKFENKRQLNGMFNAKCPICEKQTFFITRNNLFKCMKCQWNGSSVDFIRSIKGYKAQRAISYINAK